MRTKQIVKNNKAEQSKAKQNKTKQNKRMQTKKTQKNTNYENAKKKNDKILKYFICIRCVFIAFLHLLFYFFARSEERRVGKECSDVCSSDLEEKQ